jgi:hypothetical protein
VQGMQLHTFKELASSSSAVCADCSSLCEDTKVECSVDRLVYNDWSECKSACRNVSVE